MSTIIIDSGGTSSDWAILDGSGNVKQFTTAGMNPVSADVQSIVIEAQSSHSLADVDKIYMYGAGCSTPELINTVKTGLSLLTDINDIDVQSDVLGAAYALCGRDAGVVSILGTGSNTVFYDGRKIQASIVSGGYLLGDEGSGYQIGKSLLINYLRKSFDNKDQGILDHFIDLENAALINHVYGTDRPNHLIASYASLVKEISTEGRGAILVPIFQEFIDKRLLPYGEYLEQGLFFCGSIAFHFEKELSLALNSVNLQLRKTIPKPIEALIQYHNEYL